jgi:hypothetical protein
MKTTIQVLVLSAMILIIGCSGPPSASTGRAALEQKIQRESNGFIKLVSFEKTDGVSQEAMGMKIYTLKYTAEIEFTDNCFWGDGNGLIGWGGNFSADRSTGMALLDASTHFKAGKKGQKEKVTSSLTFQKTENGWNLSN